MGDFNVGLTHKYRDRAPIVEVPCKKCIHTSAYHHDVLVGGCTVEIKVTMDISELGAEIFADDEVEEVMTMTSLTPCRCVGYEPEFEVSPWT